MNFKTVAKIVFFIQATLRCIGGLLVVILHHFFEIFPCFYYQTVLVTDAKVIYYIGTAIRSNGDLPKYSILLYL